MQRRMLAPDADQPLREREQRARKLWNGRALSKSYRETRLKLEAWLARADQLEPEVAARESFLLGDKAIHQLVFDPLLPEPLVDVKERRAFVDAVLRYDRAGHAIWQRLHFNFLEAAAASRAPLARPSFSKWRRVIACIGVSLDAGGYVRLCASKRAITSWLVAMV